MDRTRVCGTLNIGSIPIEGTKTVICDQKHKKDRCKSVFFMESNIQFFETMHPYSYWNFLVMEPEEESHEFFVQAKRVLR